MPWSQWNAFQRDKFSKGDFRYISTTFTCSHVPVLPVVILARCLKSVEGVNNGMDGGRRLEAV